MAEFARERRIFVPIDEIPDLVKNAFISAEDKNFYEHPGVDPIGIARAMVANLDVARGGRPAAGRLDHHPAGDEELPADLRPLHRAQDQGGDPRRAHRASAMSKDRILELYLNEIFLGQNAYGVAAAAQRYFGKTLEDLTVAEAAYLAALPKAPSDLHPVRQRDRAIERRNYVLREMRENGYIDRETMSAAQAEPLGDAAGRARPSRRSRAPAAELFHRGSAPAHDRRRSARRRSSPAASRCAPPSTPRFRRSARRRCARGWRAGTGSAAPGAAP
jgi:penicillin-binding protein 1A